MSEIPPVYRFDSISVAGLPDRYGIGKTQFYSRRDHLGLKFEAHGNRAYATVQQVDLLDALHDHIKLGNSIESFVESLPTPETSQIITQSDPTSALIALASAIATRLTPPKTKLAELKERIDLLQTLSDRQVPIPSSDLKMVLDRRSLKKPVTAYGFQATPIGRQSGQTLWQISKETHQATVQWIPH